MAAGLAGWRLRDLLEERRFGADLDIGSEVHVAVGERAIVLGVSWVLAA
jgi:hypothetical protein